MEHIRQEYPVYGTTDYRHPAIELLQENGSRVSEFQYDSYEIIAGKPKLSGLPATYTESEEEAQTLRIFLKDALLNAIYAQTGLVTFSGPHFGSVGMLKGADYTLENLKIMLMGERVNRLQPSAEWSDDPWFLDQENRHFIKKDRKSTRLNSSHAT